MIAPTDEERDLLPWILGGLCISVGVIAIGVASIGRNAAAVAPAPVMAAAPAPAAALSPLPATAAGIASLSGAALAPPTSAPSRLLPSGQVWECTVNGQKAFSDKPCGEKPIIRQLNPTNTMDPAPALPAALSRPWEPPYPPIDDDTSGQEPEAASNFSRGAVVIVEKGRREHGPRPHHHERAAPRIH
jgi:hypothetical protein